MNTVGSGTQKTIEGPQVPYWDNTEDLGQNTSPKQSLCSSFASIRPHLPLWRLLLPSCPQIRGFSLLRPWRPPSVGRWVHRAWIFFLHRISLDFILFRAHPISSHGHSRCPLHSAGRIGFTKSATAVLCVRVSESMSCFQRHALGGKALQVSHLREGTHVGQRPRHSGQVVGRALSAACSALAPFRIQASWPRAAECTQGTPSPRPHCPRCFTEQKTFRKLIWWKHPYAASGDPRDDGVSS